MKRLFVLCASLVGCNGLLAIEDRPLRPDGGARLDADADADADADTVADSPYRRAVLEDKPVLYWRFGEATGVTAVDETHHTDAQYPTVGATLQEPGALLNDANTAVAFDGTDKIHVPEGADFAPLASFSVEVWVKRKEAPSQPLAWIVDHETFPRLGWDLVVGNNELDFERYSDNTTDEVAPAPALPPNEWHHVVGTWDGTVERIFFDGKLVATSGPATPISIGPVPGGWTIAGQNCSCSGTFYVGALDEFAIYDTALTGQRILAHFHASGR